MPHHQKPTSGKLSQSRANKSICTQAHLEIARTIPRPIIQEYQSRISSGINKFISNHKTKLQHLLNTSSTIHTSHTTQLRIGCRHLNLADDPDAAPFKIPSFIDIFRHLITLPAIIKQLTEEELAELSRILALPTKHNIYNALHNSPAGNKLADAYAYASANLLIDLTRQFPTADFHSLLFNSFTSYTILELIESQMNHVTICTFTHNGKQYPNFLYIFHHSLPRASKLTKSRIQKSFLDVIEINQIAENILRRVVFLGELINSTALPNRLIIFLTDAKKNIDDALEHNHHFRAMNVNTAVTNMRDIIIYRREELYKSIFHELIHFHNLDFKSLPVEINTILLDYIHRTHNISSANEYLLYEAITESLANTLNAAYLSRGIKEFRINLSREIMFSTFQAAKILRLCGYNSWGEFTLLTGASASASADGITLGREGKQWRQDSCVFSYYVLKLYILLNLDDYWSHLLDARIKFQTSKSHFTYLLDIFERGRNNSSLKKIMDYLLLAESGSKLKKTQKNSKGKMINKTLRMTCLDG
jgi:hypothetical protein